MNSLFIYHMYSPDRQLQETHFLVLFTFQAPPSVMLVPFCSYLMQRTSHSMVFQILIFTEISPFWAEEVSRCLGHRHLRTRLATHLYVYIPLELSPSSSLAQFYIQLQDKYPPTPNDGNLSSQYRSTVVYNRFTRMGDLGPGGRQ